MNEGELINDEFEGKWKFIEENGDYYLGEFKNGKKHGKAIDYPKDGDIIYEGDFIDGLYDGKGKLIDISNNRDYYIGEFLHGKKHGKGKQYDKNGKLIFDGEYLNGEKIEEKKD